MFRGRFPPRWEAAFFVDGPLIGMLLNDMLLIDVEVSGAERVGHGLGDLRLGKDEERRQLGHHFFVSR